MICCLNVLNVWTCLHTCTWCILLCDVVCFFLGGGFCVRFVASSASWCFSVPEQRCCVSRINRSCSKCQVKLTWPYLTWARTITMITGIILWFDQSLECWITLGSPTAKADLVIVVVLSFVRFFWPSVRRGDHGPIFPADIRHHSRCWRSDTDSQYHAKTNLLPSPYHPGYFNPNTPRCYSIDSSFETPWRVGAVVNFGQMGYSFTCCALFCGSVVVMLEQRPFFFCGKQAPWQLSAANSVRWRTWWVKKGQFVLMESSVSQTSRSTTCSSNWTPQRLAILANNNSSPRVTSLSLSHQRTEKVSYLSSYTAYTRREKHRYTDTWG